MGREGKGGKSGIDRKVDGKRRKGDEGLIRRRDMVSARRGFGEERWREEVGREQGRKKGIITWKLKVVVKGDLYTSVWENPTLDRVGDLATL